MHARNAYYTFSESSDYGLSKNVFTFVQQPIFDLLHTGTEMPGAAWQLSLRVDSVLRVVVLVFCVGITMKTCAWCVLCSRWREVLASKRKNCYFRSSQFLFLARKSVLHSFRRPFLW